MLTALDRMLPAGAPRVSFCSKSGDGAMGVDSRVLHLQAAAGSDMLHACVRRLPTGLPA